MMLEPILTIDLRFERDVVQARQRARDIAAGLGFDHQEQIRIATATSEIARNAFRYAMSGRVAFSASTANPQSLQVEVRDKGKGISHLDHILEGRYKSQTGMGMGIVGTRRLMDEFFIQSGKDGTTVTFSKALPKGALPITSTSVKGLREDLTRRNPESPYEEIQRQNLELMKTLSELRSRQEELDLLNHELEDTNRGVVALYAELEDRADYLRRTAELKSAFLSNMSHEFRTPLNSIISLSRMLGDSLNGPSAADQRLEVAYIQNSARDLLELVNDLLDMAKIEAGKLQLRPRMFEISELFGALRGMLKPLLSETSMVLIFEEPEGIPTLFTDEGKLSQILRNLISNAIKFTPKGEVRVSAVLEGEEDISFTVADTGVGIEPQHLAAIFKEFAQIDNELQRKHRGTGLGLPLSQNLAGLLGGEITVQSEPGIGSRFSVRIKRYLGAPATVSTPIIQLDKERIPVLLLEDNHETRFLFQTFMERSEFQLIGVANLIAARQFLERYTPTVIICDLLIDGRLETDFIRELRAGTKTKDVPILAISTVREEAKAMAAGADAFLLKPIQAETFLAAVYRLSKKERVGKILLIDDQEVSRYVLRQYLPQTSYEIMEARSGREGLEIAKEENPSLIFLDLRMADLDGLAVLAALKEDAATKEIPVVIHTSRIVDSGLRGQLTGILDILPKSALNDDNAGHLVDDILARAGVSPHVKGDHV